MNTSGPARTPSVQFIDTDVPSFRDYVAVVRRQYQIVLLAVLVGLLVAMAFLAAGGTTYISKTSVLVNQIPGDVAAGGGQGAVNMDTQTALADGTGVTEGAAERLGVDLAVVKSSATATASADTANVLIVEYSSPAADAASKGSLVVAEQYLALRSEIGQDNLDAAQEGLKAEQAALESELESLTDTLATSADRTEITRAEIRSNQVSDRLAAVQAELLQTSSVVQPGRVISGPSDPASAGIKDKLLIVLVGAFAGLFIGLFAAFVRDRLDGRVRALDDLQALGLPEVGIVQALPIPEVVARELADDALQDYQRVGVTMLRLLELAGARTCLVVEPSESRTEHLSGTFAAALAVVLAQSDRSTAVVAGDLREDVLGNVFTLPVRALGVRDYCMGAADLEQVVHQPKNLPGVSVVPAGAATKATSRTLRSEEYGKLLQELSSDSDYVLIDSPPMDGAADALILAGLVDAVLYVLTPQSEVDSFHESHRQVDQLGTMNLGFVLVESTSRRSAKRRPMVIPQ